MYVLPVGSFVLMPFSRCTSTFTVPVRAAPTNRLVGGAAYGSGAAYMMPSGFAHAAHTNTYRGRTS